MNTRLERVGGKQRKHLRGGEKGLCLNANQFPVLIVRSHFAAVGLNSSHTCPCSLRAYQLVETSLHGFSGLFVVQLLAASSPLIGASQLNVDDLWTSMYGSGGSQVCNVSL